MRPLRGLVPRRLRARNREGVKVHQEVLLQGVPEEELDAESGVQVELQGISGKEGEGKEDRKIQGEEPGAAAWTTRSPQGQEEGQEERQR